MAIPAQLALFIGDVLAAARERGLNYREVLSECLHVACAAAVFERLDVSQVVEMAEAAHRTQLEHSELVATLLAGRRRPDA